MSRSDFSSVYIGKESVHCSWPSVTVYQLSIGREFLDVCFIRLEAISQIQIAPLQNVSGCQRICCNYIILIDSVKPSWDYKSFTNVLSPPYFVIVFFFRIEKVHYNTRQVWWPNWKRRHHKCQKRLMIWNNGRWTSLIKALFVCLLLFLL